ncbi:MAG: hypothetical protein E6J74_41315, partial [Deltaproteobacteria bacterium]
MEYWSVGVMGFRRVIPKPPNTPVLQNSITPTFREKPFMKRILPLVAIAAFLYCKPLFAQSNFYQGKTITIVVASTVGGGYDLWARLTARHIVKYIPGHPSIVVQNMPGAGNIIGANYVYGVAKPDGLTLGAVNPALYFDQLVGRSEVKFDWGKFNWIGSPEKNDVVYYMRADTPFKTIED